MLSESKSVGRQKHWLALPALTLLLLASCVSIMASGRLTLRLVLPALVYGSIVPLLQMLSLAVVRVQLPWRQAVALFFRGHMPWTIWLLASAVLWGLVPFHAAFRFGDVWRFTAIAPAGCSLVIDYRFFRGSNGWSPRDAMVRLSAQRAMCWGPCALLFVAPAGLQVVASALGL